MIGFSAAWLRLREPADHRARNASIARAMSAALMARDSVRVLDLGCGTGSNLRALARRLPRRQDWCLVDHDPGLLDAAGRALGQWAESATETGAGLELRRDERTIAVRRVEADLARDLERMFDPGPDLVTAAALLDLVSLSWIERFVRAAAAARSFVYVVLTYDGSGGWQPSHPADDAVKAAFDVHQRHDKGFGPAAGPKASHALATALATMGYSVRTGSSPWRLDASDADLMGELADGYAAAVRETGLVQDALIDDWLAARRSGCRWVVGHEDLLAIPPA